MLNELSIVIPTYNRPEFLGRLLAYYQSKESAAKVLILDSSESDVKAKNARVTAECGERFRHVVFPLTLPVASKLAQGLALVDTPFCALCADDDIVFIEGLNRALTYLKAHPECVCTDGIYLNFFRSGKDIQLKIEYASKGIDAEHPAARVFRLFQRYESLFYGVFRTSDLAEIFSGVSRNPSLHYQELFQATGALLIGKSHRLPVFYAGRQHCAPADPTRNRWQTYYWFAENREEFLEHYVRYRGELWEFYQRRGARPRLSKDEFVKSMDIAHAVFFGTGCPPEYFYSVLQSQWPKDPFKQDPEDDDVCNQLKVAPRRSWRGPVRRFAKWLQEAASTDPPSSGLNDINHCVRRQFRTPWTCVLAPELRWLANTGRFREAYFELCRYMDGS